MKRGPGQKESDIARQVARQRRARVIAFVESLPQGKAIAFGNHLALEVRGKRFGWYLDDHHGDGRLAINCKAPLGLAQDLAKHMPDRFHIPKYVGNRGWLGMWVDTPRIDWSEVEKLLAGAYRLAAPRKLIGELDANLKTP